MLSLLCLFVSRVCKGGSAYQKGYCSRTVGQCIENQPSCKGRYPFPSPPVYAATTKLPPRLSTMSTPSTPVFAFRSNDRRSQCSSAVSVPVGGVVKRRRVGCCRRACGIAARACVVLVGVLAATVLLYSLVLHSGVTSLTKDSVHTAGAKVVAWASTRTPARGVYLCSPQDGVVGCGAGWVYHTSGRLWKVGEHFVRELADVFTNQKHHYNYNPEDASLFRSASSEQQ